MASPISQRARGYVRSRSSSVMEYQCRIERVSKPDYDPDDLLSIPNSSRTTVYEGICRIWETSGAESVAIGDADIDFQNTQLSTPWDAPLAKKDDEVLITSAPTQDLALQDRRFQIQSSAKAGELRATRRYAVRVLGR